MSRNKQHYRPSNHVEETNEVVNETLSVETDVTLDMPVVSTPPVESPKPIVGNGNILKQAGNKALEDKDLPEVVDMMQHGDGAIKAAMSHLLTYCREMAPGKPQSQKSLEQYQLSLIGALFTLLGAEEKQFRLAIRATLAVFKANLNKCFSPTSRNRGLNNAELGVIDNKNMRFLTRVVDALTITAGVNHVSDVAKHVDMKKLMEAIPNVRIRQNLIAYYSV